MNGAVKQIKHRRAMTQAPVAGPLVLIVEDHDDSRLMLKAMLELHEVRVLEADDGRAGIEIAERERPDLILMDFSLPDLDGIAAMRRIRQCEALQQVPVVFITGYTGDSYREAILSAGGNDSLAKPISYQQLYRLVKRHLRKGMANNRTNTKY